MKNYTQSIGDLGQHWALDTIADFIYYNFIGVK